MSEHATKLVQVTTQACLHNEDSQKDFDKLIAEVNQDTGNADFIDSLQKIVYKGARIEKRLTDLLENKTHVQVIRDILKNIEQSHKH